MLNYLQSYKQFQKALENVEDNDDVVAANNATKEQEDVILEDDTKAETVTSKGLDDENPEIDRSMLPPIFLYGLDFVESLQEAPTLLEMEGQNGMEIEGNETVKEEDENSEEEDFVIEPVQDSEDEDNRPLVLYCVVQYE